MMRYYFSFIISLFCLLLQAQIPNGYYKTAEGKSGAELKTALFNIIGSHTVLSYNDLWTDFQKTDKRADGSVWDVYSNCPFTFSSNQCGNYVNVCDCYNREHLMPKSWFGDVAPMNVDLFHIYPTDGKVNGQRSNYPLGECSGGTSLSTDALGKLGSSTYSTYTSTVFEPADEYKGDFARTYFYMVTCYEDKVATWTSDQLANNSYPALSAWSVSLLLKWNAQDTVSEKEINRNNVIYTTYQKNRNPFIDHPELANYIWGDKTASSWSATASINKIVKDSPIDIFISQEKIIIKNPHLENFTYRIMDIKGQVLYSATSSAMEQDVFCENFSTGVYIVDVEYQSGQEVKKFIK